MVEEMEPGAQLRIMLKGEKMDGSEFTKTMMLPVGDEKTGAERLTAIGIETRDEEGKILIDNVVFSSAAEKAGIDFDQEITEHPGADQTAAETAACSFRPCCLYGIGLVCAARPQKQT